MKIQQNQNTWLIIFPLSVFLLFDFVQLNIMAPISPYLMSDLSLSPEQLGWISSTFFYVDCALLIPAGFFLDRYSFSWLMMGSVGIALVGILIFLIEDSWGNALIWRALSGVAGAFSYLSCIKIITLFFSPKQRGLFIGGTGMIIMLAGLIAQYPINYLLMHHGLFFVLKWNLLFGIIVISIIFLMCPKKNPNHAISTTCRSYQKKHYWLIAIYASLINFPLFVLGALWGNLYVHHVYSISLEKASVVISMIFIGNMIGSPLLGIFSDWLKDRRCLMVLTALIYCITLCCILYHDSDTSYEMLCVLFLILGFSTGAQTLAYALIIDETRLNETAQKSGLVSLFSVGGGALAQTLFGWFVGQESNYQDGMLFLICSAVLAMIVSLAIYYKFNLSGNLLCKNSK